MGMLQRLVRAAKVVAKHSAVGPALRRSLRPHPLQAAFDLGEAGNWPAALDSLFSEEGQRAVAEGGLHEKLRAQINHDLLLKIVLTHTRRRLLLDPPPDYPYPRWLEWEVPAPRSRIDRMAGFFGREAVRFTERPFDVLFAGCGTGAKAITYTIGYGPKARVLAIDLSLASLAHAKRMAERYGVTHQIECVRADLLRLPDLERSFDIVECSGVLHHLDDPVAGGRALVSRLRPGGIAHISLYSERSRRELLHLRAREDFPGVDASRDAMRAFRWRVIHDDPQSIERRIPLRWDFFDLSRCKDLIFHPLEHRYTVPGLARFLDAVGLEFGGFELPPIPEDLPWLSYPSDEQRSDLMAWDAFDRRAPMAFSNLFEIWARSAR